MTLIIPEPFSNWSDENLVVSIFSFSCSFGISYAFSYRGVVYVALASVLSSSAPAFQLKILLLLHPLHRHLNQGLMMIPQFLGYGQFYDYLKDTQTLLCHLQL